MSKPVMVRRNQQPIGPWRIWLINRRKYYADLYAAESEYTPTEGCGPVERLADELGVTTRDIRRWVTDNKFVDMYKLDEACCHAGHTELPRQLYPQWFEQDPGYEHIADLAMFDLAVAA